MIDSHGRFYGPQDSSTWTAHRRGKAIGLRKAGDLPTGVAQGAERRGRRSRAVRKRARRTGTPFGSRRGAGAGRGNRRACDTDHLQPGLATSVLPLRHATQNGLRSAHVAVVSDLSRPSVRAVPDAVPEGQPGSVSLHGLIARFSSDFEAGIDTTRPRHPRRVGGIGWCPRRRRPTRTRQDNASPIR